MSKSRRNFLQTIGTGVTAAGASLILPTAAGAQRPAPRADESFPFHVGEGRRSMMWPIRSELKSERLKFDAPIDPISWAYMKELRENHATRRILPVNPYVEVYQFRDNLYGLFTHNLDGGGDVWMFLTIGPERAMLVDTAYGLGDIKGLVDELTGGKPLFVANTHEHFDHAYGNCRFDKIYCHEALAPLLARQNPHQWDYLFDEYGDNVWVNFDRADLPPFRQFEIAGVKDGHVFDLGGDHQIELVFLGGHSPGHAAYLDRKNRLVFTGDDIICDTSSNGTINMPRPLPNNQNTLLSVFRANLARLVERSGEFDYVFPAHFMVDIDKQVLVNQLEALDQIIARPDVYDYSLEVWAKGGGDVPASIRYAKHIRDFAVILYTFKKD